VFRLPGKEAGFSAGLLSREPFRAATVIIADGGGFYSVDPIAFGHLAGMQDDRKGIGFEWHFQAGK
jgi:hypothetical protein